MAVANLFSKSPGLPLVAASILSADFADLGAECRAALAAGCDLLHLDVMDGSFVPNLTMGPDVCRCLRRALPDAFLDVHLMVDDPARFVRPFADAGADHMTFHIEAVPEPAALAALVRESGLTVGLAINPPTPAESIEPWIDEVDLVLVMSVNPGFSGQSFMKAVLDKTARLRPLLGDHQRLEMDGGINADTARLCRDRGCDVLVAASAIFGSGEYAKAVAALRGPVGATGGRR